VVLSGETCIRFFGALSTPRDETTRRTVENKKTMWSAIKSIKMNENESERAKTHDENGKSF
jgi:hypothetical protein